MHNTHCWIRFSASFLFSPIATAPSTRSSKKLSGRTPFGRVDSTSGITISCGAGTTGFIALGSLLYSQNHVHLLLRIRFLQRLVLLCPFLQQFNHLCRYTLINCNILSCASSTRNAHSKPPLPIPLLCTTYTTVSRRIHTYAITASIRVATQRRQKQSCWWRTWFVNCRTETKTEQLL